MHRRGGREIERQREKERRDREREGGGGEGSLLSLLIKTLLLGVPCPVVRI